MFDNIELSVNITKFLKIKSASDPLIPKLEEFITYCSDTYYNTAKEIISDADYDSFATM